MRTIFKKEDLIHALERVQRAAQAKVTSNTNNGFLIIVEENHVEFQANDYTIGIKTSCPATIEETGSVVIAAPHLLTNLKEMPSSSPLSMELSPEKNSVIFKSEKNFSSFPIREQSEFPEVKEIDHSQHFHIKGKTLIDMVNKVQFAAATDKQKPFFTGILFEVSNLTFTMATTNTHRLATKEITLDTPISYTGRFIVPANIMSDVIRLISDEEEMIEVSWAKNHVAFTFGNTYFISTLINGEYPDYKRVIPTTFHAHATLDLRKFEECVRFIMPISSELDYKTINFNFEKDTLKIFEGDAEIGSAKTAMPVVLEGEPLQITFNCHYIQDIIKHSKGETVILHLMKGGPMLVEQEEDKTYLYVVTPMRGR